MIHGIWKSQKKSHSTLRAKRATFTFWVDKSLLKMPKMADLTSFWKMRLFEEFSNNVLSNTNSISTVYFEVAFAFISRPKCNLRHWEQTKWMNFQSDENKFYFKVSCCLELQKTYFLPRQPNFLSHTWDSKTFQKEPRPKSFIRLLCAKVKRTTIFERSEKTNSKLVGTHAQRLKLPL